MNQTKSDVPVNFEGACMLALTHGQEFRATLNDRVQDAAGAAVAGAKVAAMNASTNETASTETLPRGDYTIPLLKPGPYSVGVEAMKSN